jgi:hypothetical protein
MILEQQTGIVYETFLNILQNRRFLRFHCFKLT